MRIFVFGTGRCGVSSFCRAVRHATNFTVGDESHANQPWRNLDYPDQHIEGDSALILSYPALLARYPNSVFLYLQREREACCEALVAQEHRSMAALGRMLTRIDDCDPAHGAGVWYDVALGLADLWWPRVRTLKLEALPDMWRDVWHWLGLEGDVDASAREWEASRRPA